VNFKAFKKRANFSRKVPVFDIKSVIFDTLTPRFQAPKSPFLMSNIVERFLENINV